MENLTGSYVGIAGIILMILTHFGINASVDQIVNVIGGIVTVYGIIHQAVAHKSLVASYKAASGLPLK